MMYEEMLSLIDNKAAVRAVGETLKRIDIRLVDHGERVGYIANEIANAGGFEFDRKILLLLCLFHDIGAYKTDEIDRMVEFETRDVLNHSAYGYLFLKYLTPLNAYAEAILYHHSPWKEIENLPAQTADYAAIIHIADRIDIAAQNMGDEQINAVIRNARGLFRPEYVEAFSSCRGIVDSVRDGSCSQVFRDAIYGYEISVAEALEYMKMIVYSIDFRSEYTVTHTINTVSISMYLARVFGLDKAQCDCIYLGSLLHDVGKISIPLDILEFPGRLSDEKMRIMRTHVEETEKLISGTVSDSVLQIAVRHHEKLDGSGYPRGLKADDLDVPQRIVAIADIVSALCNKRSYKESFPKEKTVQILSSMSDKLLDKDICMYVCENYDTIMESTDSTRDEIIGKYVSIMNEYNKLSSK